MTLDATFLRSRVARRIFLLFVLCALLPLSALALIAFQHVSGQLTMQSQQQLRQASKAQGMSVYERLRFLEAELRLIAADWSEGSRASRAAISVPLQDLEERFTALEIVTADGRRQALVGRMGTRLELTPEEQQHLRSGKTVVSTASCDAPAPCIFMSQDLDRRHPGQATLIGQIKPAYLWDVDKLPAFVDLCVLDQSNRVLFCSADGEPALPDGALEEMTRSTAGQFRWVRNDREHLAGYWTVYLKPVFLAPRWVVVLSQARGDVLSPLAAFRRIFLLITLLALWVVLLLSLIQIRRSLVPLEKLQEGTRRIANQDFRTRVTVTSGDEFQELATSLNTMAGRLGRQFDSLRTINEIDRAILSSWETPRIIDAVLIRLRDHLPHEGVSLSLLRGTPPHTAVTHVRAAGAEGEARLETPVTPDDLEQLHRHPEALVFDGPDGLPHYLAPLAGRGLRSFLVVPIFLEGQVSAIISLGHSVPVHDDDDVQQVRQVADQVAVALSNARLIEELHQLHWGTLTALARAIDAKSPWTSGHSERVTNLAIEIGRAMGLPADELEVLQRGGLLHDIGKIGIPGSILDKPGKLNDQERRQVQAHVRIGVRILEPIPGLGECLPIVRQHHEWFDGSGYPDGLKGEAISLHARILAVADTYDALVSSRPYRAGLDPERAVEIIRKSAGTQFDPRAVQAFLQVAARDRARRSGRRSRLAVRNGRADDLSLAGAPTAPGDRR